MQKEWTYERQQLSEGYVCTVYAPDGKMACEFIGPTQERDAQEFVASMNTLSAFNAALGRHFG